MVIKIQKEFVHLKGALAHLADEDGGKRKLESQKRPLPLLFFPDEL